MSKQSLDTTEVMSKRTHVRSTHHKTGSSEEGFIANEIKKSMNKNEKIIMGILVAGILVFLLLSIIVLFTKSKVNNGGNFTPTGTTQVPTKAVVTTPYPTVPPITDFTLQVNENRWYPDSVTITHGHSVNFFNIGAAATTITAAPGQSDAPAVGVVSNSEDKSVKFDTAGVYKYVRNQKPTQVLTITAR